MKNLRYHTVLFVFILSTVAITSCTQNNAEPNGETNTTTEVAEATYACPMDCENGKTYAEAGTCPVCKMDLKEVEN